MTEIPKEEQLAALADRSFSKLIRKYSGKSEDYDFKAYFTVDREELTRYLAERTAAVESVYARHPAAPPGHDVYRVVPMRGGYAAAWMDHGVPRQEARFPDLAHAVATVIFMELGLYRGESERTDCTLELDDFLANVASEPERTIARTERSVRYRHLLGAPAPPEVIDDWQNRRPHQRLPPDLQQLVSRINGIHLWADAEVGRSYTGLAPIEEWELARIKMYGPDVDPGRLGDRYVAISYDQDNGALAVLDVDSGKYFLMDTAGPDTTCPIASSAGELLHWLWRRRRRIEPK